MDELTLKLSTIFVTRFVVNNFTEVIVPYLKYRMKKGHSGAP